MGKQGSPIVVVRSANNTLVRGANHDNNRSNDAKSNFFGGKSLTLVFWGEYNQRGPSETIDPPAKLLGFDNAAEVARLRIPCRVWTELERVLSQDAIVSPGFNRRPTKT